MTTGQQPSNPTAAQALEESRRCCHIDSPSGFAQNVMTLRGMGPLSLGPSKEGDEMVQPKEGRQTQRKPCRKLKGCLASPARGRPAPPGRSLGPRLSSCSLKSAQATREI
jgi:hypothetical protein